MDVMVVVHRVNRIDMDVMVVVHRIRIDGCDVVVINRIYGCDGGCTQDQSY